MSDPKRATLITVGDPKSEKNKVNKTVRLTINLDESNESKYPELNYKELVIAEERTIQRPHKVENGKTDGLHPFSDNDEDVERVARKFEQKYGGKSTYGRKGRSKHDDFADIGAGYDENDSFIDNTDGYDEMIPPECDTLYGGFYINSGSLEFKNVDPAASDDEGPRGRSNKRRISSSSSEEESSSSSGSESAGEKPKPLLNGTASHHTEHRKKKNKKIDKKKAKKIRRTDSSAATSGKQTSDDNVQGEASSADSRTSHSDSLTSKPAPSSENPATSDSSRDTEAKTEVKLPTEVELVLQELEALVQRPPASAPAGPHAAPARSVEALADPHVFRLERALSACGAESAVRRAVWTRAARALRVSRTRLLHRARALAGHTNTHTHTLTHTASRQNSTSQAATNSAPASATATATASGQKRKADDDLKDFDPSALTDDEKEAKIVETLQRLKALIDERKPSMIANYNAECERVQEERKKIQIASAAEGAPQGECNKRLPKRRFPWCPRTRTLLTRLVRLSKDQESAGIMLARRALPLFPSGFVRMPTLLRQADLNKEFKVTDLKRQRLNSSSQPYPQPTSVIQPAASAAPTSTAGPTPTSTAGPTPTPPPAAFPEPIHFPSSLTVTTMKPSPEKIETAVGTEEKDKTSASFGNIYNILSLNKDLLVEKQDERKKDAKKDDSYIPSNNIGSITITAVPVPPNTQKPEKKPSSLSNEKKPEGLIRVKSPAALNEMVNKQEKVKAVLENAHKRENETVHTQKDSKDKGKSSEHVHKRDDTSHKPEKSKALETIHKREINNVSHRPDKDRTSEVPNTHSHSKDKSYKYEKVKALENIHKRDKDKHRMEKSHRNHSSSSSRDTRIDIPLHIETNFQLKPKEPTPSPKPKDEVVHKTIDNIKIDERNIPRPALIPVHHSPTFAKPDKRPPEVKKKKEVLIISDVDPLEAGELVSVDDSSSDVEVVEDKSDQSVNVTVPSNNKSLREVRKDGVRKDSDIEKLDEATKEDFDSVMKNLRDLEQHSQEAPKFNSSSYGGVITSAKRAQCAGEGRRALVAHGFGPDRKDKLSLAKVTKRSARSKHKRTNESNKLL